MARALPSLLAAVALLATVAPERSEAADRPVLAIKGAAHQTLRICGTDRGARAIGLGAPARAVLASGGETARLSIDVCRDGRWRHVRVRPMGAIATRNPRDLRLTASASGRRSVPRYLRVGPGEIVSEPLRLRVTNRNRTPDECRGDGERYTVRGHLVGPRTRIERARPSVTLYLHGSVLGEPTWRFRGVAGLDHLRAMAERGHVSAAYDQLGYGRSDIPPGGQVCGGTQADVAHQVIGALRERFDRVALFGFSFGGFAAELEALTFRDVDALAVESWSDHVGRPFYRETLPSVAACGRGGEAKRPGAPGGYTYYFRHEDEHVMLANARPAVIAALHEAHERDPCGLTASAGQILRNREAVGAIDVPVLLVYGKRDALFGRRAADRQRESFHGTDDLVYRRIARAGHFLTLERRHPAFRALVSRWLERRGF